MWLKDFEALTNRSHRHYSVSSTKSPLLSPFSGLKGRKTSLSKQTDQIDIFDTVGGDKKRLLNIEKQLVHDANQTISELKQEVAQWKDKVHFLEKEIEDVKAIKIEDKKSIQSSGEISLMSSKRNVGNSWKLKCHLGSEVGALRSEIRDLKTKNDILLEKVVEQEHQKVKIASANGLFFSDKARQSWKCKFNC